MFVEFPQMSGRGQYRVRDVSVGEVFGRLTVLATRKPGDPAALVRCCCECGKETSTGIHSLLTGMTKSCGCLRRDFSTLHNRKHGHGSAKNGRSPTYRSWCAMKSRCLNPNFPSYPQYGGRGIAVCERWLHFELFLMDMGERPEGTTLHRLANDGDYEPGNCEWAAATRQARNKTTTKLVTFAGRTQSLADWADETGINASTLWTRLQIYGWSAEETLTTPVARGQRLHPFKADETWRKAHGDRMRKAHGDRLRRTMAANPSSVARMHEKLSRLIWITNGSESRRILPGHAIPAGWWKGRP